jgi:hypothetical protein
MSHRKRPGLPIPSPGRPVFADDGGLADPEMAAFHATWIQGGFSTPLRECARMLLAGGRGEQRALAWMAARDLAPEDLEWDPGMLEHYRARHEQETGQ